MWNRARADRVGVFDAAAGRYIIPREKLLRRLRRRKPGVRCAVEALVERVWSVVTLAGIAHLAAVACLLIQAACLNFYLRRYLSPLASLTFFAEVPLLLHLLWFWREESAARAAPTQWVVYSWLHAAKVVVLYCKVMPALPAVSASTEEIAVFRFFGGRTFGDLLTHSPANLGNLLLLTPVFYSLLMLRTTVGIFGFFSRKITVDLLMHFDMLWHVAIDMVDQVDMFSYARLAEWVSEDVFRKNQSTLMFIQMIIPFLLFLSITLQAQSLPGVIVDQWHIPDPPPSVAFRPPLGPPPTQAAGDRAETAALALRSDSGLSVCPMPAPESVGRGSLESGSEELRGSTRGQQQQQQQQQGPYLVDVAAAAAAAAAAVAVSAATDGVSSFRTARDTLDSVAADSVNNLSRVRPLGGSITSGTTSWKRPKLSRTSTVSATFGAIGATLQPGTRADALPTEKHRRRRLQAIIHFIHRQNILIARKRSAVVSIFFVDLPFVTLRIALWVLTLSDGTSDLPALGVKNGICILLNALQYTLVRMVNRDFFVDIQRRLAVYRCCHAPSSLNGNGVAGGMGVASADGGLGASGDHGRASGAIAGTASTVGGSAAPAAASGGAAVGFRAASGGAAVGFRARDGAAPTQPAPQAPAPATSSGDASVSQPQPGPQPLEPTSMTALSVPSGASAAAAAVKTASVGVNSACVPTGSAATRTIASLAAASSESSDGARSRMRNSTDPVGPWFFTPTTPETSASHISSPQLTAESPTINSYFGRDSLGSCGVWKEVQEAERRVGRETVRSPSVCVHFWALLCSFSLGYVLAKGEPVFSVLGSHFKELL